MNHDQYSDDYIEQILTRTRTVAIVGASPNPARPSHEVMVHLRGKGYRVYPVNPAEAGNEIAGEQVYASLAGIPEAIDMVDIFRRSDAAGQFSDEAVAISARYVWMQLDVRDDEAARRAEAAGLSVVMNRCPEIEIARLNLKPVLT